MFNRRQGQEKQHISGNITFRRHLCTVSENTPRGSQWAETAKSRRGHHGGADWGPCDDLSCWGQSVRGEDGKCERTREGDTDTDWQAQWEQPGGLRVSRELSSYPSRTSEPLPLTPSDLEPAAVAQLLGKAPLSNKEAL